MYEYLEINVFKCVIFMCCQFNKGMVPLGSVCSEDDDVDENYVPMSAATTEPPVAPR